MRMSLIAVGLVLLCAVSLLRADDLRSELPADTKADTKTINAYRILFIGNSITRHGFDANTKKNLKWDHLAGMAATSEDKDFAHLLAAKIQAAMPDRKVVTQFSGIASGGKGTPEERAGGLAAKLKDTKADLVVFQHGEHEQYASGPEAMEKTYRLVLDVFESIQPRPLMVTVGVWSPSDGKSYGGWAKILNDIMARISAQRNIPFVSVDKIAADPACHGWGESPGVKWHPNDEGMRRYAEEIYAAWEKLRIGKAVNLEPVRVGEVAYQKVFTDIAGWSASPADCYRIDASTKSSARVVIGAAGTGETGTEGDRDVLGAVAKSKSSAYVIRGKLPLLPRYRGCLMNVSILVAAKDVAEPAKPWEGVRSAFHYKIADDGGYNDFVHGGYGTFAQRELKMTTRIPADATEVSCELGLLGQSGEVSLERITMTVAGLPRTSLTPPAGPVHKGHDLERLRGFNTGLYSLSLRRPGVIKSLAAFGDDWKSNVFKLWFTVRKDLAQTDRELAEWLPEVEKALATAQESGQLVVLHVGNGWHNPVNAGNDLSYEDPAYANKLVDLSRIMAERFKGDRRIWAIELLNESVQRLPAAPGCLDYPDLMERCAQAINEVDPERTIIVQPEQWWGSRGYEKMRPIKAKNVVYAVHFYAPFSVTCQGISEVQSGKKTWTKLAYPNEKWDKEALRRDLQPIRDFQKAYGVHMVVTEFSCIRWAPGDSRERLLSDMIDLFEEFGWDWMYHDAIGWQGWDISLGNDPWDTKRPAEPTGAETLMRSWFARNQRQPRP